LEHNNLNLNHFLLYVYAVDIKVNCANLNAEGGETMKKYTGAIIGGLFGAAVIVTLFFAIVLSGGKQASDVDKTVVVDEPAGTREIKATECMQGLEICNDLDDDCDGETDEGCDGPNKFEYCWNLPGVSPKIAFEGEIGYRYASYPEDRTGDHLVATTSWQVLAETKNTKSACFSFVLDPGWYIEYQMVSRSVPPLWGCVGHYPPGVLNGVHVATLGGVQVSPVLIDDRAGGCKFRFHRPIP